MNPETNEIYILDAALSKDPVLKRKDWKAQMDELSENKVRYLLTPGSVYVGNPNPKAPKPNPPS